MNPKELLEEWESGESTGVRPKRLQAIRDDIHEITGLVVPRRVSSIEGWLDGMKPQITRKIRVAADEYESEAESSDEDEGDEQDEES